MTDTWADGATLRQRLDDHFDAHFHDRLDIQDKASVANCHLSGCGYAPHPQYNSLPAGGHPA